MPECTRATRLPVSAAEAFRWHARPGALERLTPPWEEVSVLDRTGGIEDPGSRVSITTRIGPFRKRWVAEHRDFVEGRMFRDVQVEGPFARWDHTHTFRPAAEGGCILEDREEYALPGGWLGRTIGGGAVRRRLERIFSYRHETTAADIMTAVNGMTPIGGDVLCVLANPDTAGNITIIEEPQSQQVIENEILNLRVVATNDRGEPQKYRWLLDGDRAPDRRRAAQS